MELLGLWIGAFLTLCIFSFLYRDNPFFRFAESIFAGVSLGYYIGQEASQTIVPNLIEPLKGEFGVSWCLTLFAGLVGINLYTRYIKKINWLARWSLAIYVGYYVGVNMVQKLHGEVLPQAQNTIVGFSVSPEQAAPINGILLGLGFLALAIALVVSMRGKIVLGPAIFAVVWLVLRTYTYSTGLGGAALLLDNLLLIVGVLSVLLYFFFSLEHRGAVGGISRLGIWFLMIGFGAAFGYTVMGRVSLLIGRMDFLINQWFLGTLRQIGLG